MPILQSLGGKEQLLAEFPTIKEQVAPTDFGSRRPASGPQVLPRSKSISSLVSSLVLPYLMYLARTQPDISTQAMVRRQKGDCALHDIHDKITRCHFIGCMGDITLRLTTYTSPQGACQVPQVPVPRVQRPGEKGQPEGELIT
jgi:hypothetical protein